MKLTNLAKAQNPLVKTIVSNDQLAKKSAKPVAVVPPKFDHFIATNEYGSYCVPNEYGDREVPALLREGKVYEPRTLEFMAAHLGHGDIVTGGAFVGDFFPAMGKALHPDALLHSFEPNPTSFAAAKHTLELNGINNAILSPVAVGEKADILPLLIARNKGETAMAARAKIMKFAQPHNNTIDVEVTTLDALIPADRRVSILQLDIEGFELQAVLGAKRMIADSKPIIILEAARRVVRRTYLMHLNNLFPDAGYQIHDVIERNTIFVPH